ncbi:phage major capsid protein [Anaerovorax odorimutans]|uniref:Phage major capsid protein n=1 Tax=Anaerovorax odorimutans TaxID=109327 RepID=A0ABT1RR76_9FIRM|nr:phage major capsid protein [Anaerovorax odorimutans]MCQ4637677.1 phage major capsid protein [Anaerovorax odorimutans]
MKKKELLDSINAKVREVKKLAAEDKIEEAKTAKAELKNLQEKFDLIKDLDEGPEINPRALKPVQKTTNSVGKAFVNAIKAKLDMGRLSEDDAELLNKMSEGSDLDGGLTVPQDISTRIGEYRRAEDALENEVNVEKVTKDKGSRVFELHADQIPFDNVEEAAEFPEAETPTLKQIKYEVKKKGGILKVTRELMMDSSESILSFLIKWIGKKAKATRNMLILKKIDEITAGKEIQITGLDDLKDIFNINLDPAIAVSAKAITNQDGFAWLDKLKDSDGKYIVQPDPTKATPGLLFGKYPIRTVSKKTMKTVGGKIPVIAGDLKEAITIFDKEHTTIETNDQAGELWKFDLTGIKARERLDIQAIDEEAVVKGYVIKIYTRKELNEMKVEEIDKLATSLGYTLTGSTKAEKITSFIAAQEA